VDPPFPESTVPSDQRSSRSLAGFSFFVKTPFSAASGTPSALFHAVIPLASSSQLSEVL